MTLLSAWWLDIPGRHRRRRGTHLFCFISTRFNPVLDRLRAKLIRRRSPSSRPNPTASLARRATPAARSMTAPMLATTRAATLSSTMITTMTAKVTTGAGSSARLRKVRALMRCQILVLRYISSGSARAMILTTRIALRRRLLRRARPMERPTERPTEKARGRGRPSLDRFTCLALVICIIC